MPLQARDKIVYTSHVRFNKGGFVTEPDFEAFDDKGVCRQGIKAIPEQGNNKDVKELRLGPPAVDYIYDFDKGTLSVYKQAKEQPVKDYKDKVNAPETLQNDILPGSKKRGRPKGLKNRTINNIPLENRQTTRAQRSDAPPVCIAKVVSKVNGEEVPDKGNLYYTIFLAGF